MNEPSKYDFEYGSSPASPGFTHSVLIANLQHMHGLMAGRPKLNAIDTDEFEADFQDHLERIQDLRDELEELEGSPSPVATFLGIVGVMSVGAALALSALLAASVIAPF